MEVSQEQFEQSLKKISPELADTLKLLFNRVRRKLQDDIASPLIAPKFKSAFNATTNNLAYIKRFIFEEAEKLKENDNGKSEIIVQQYLQLIEEVDNARENLFISNSEKTIDEMGHAIDRLRMNTDNLAKEMGTYKPSEEEINNILKNID